jgi:ketosteroid isomerase-like protein
MESVTAWRDTAWAMSKENVELAKRLNEAGKRGDVEAGMQFLAEDVVGVEFGDRLDAPNVFYGRKALIDYYSQLADVFEDFERETDEWVDAGDWTISVGHWVGTGQSSGVPVEGPQSTNALRWREGKIVEFLMNLESKEAALEAVRMRE